MAVAAPVPTPAKQVINSISGCCPGLLELRLYMLTASGTLQPGVLKACTSLTGLKLLGVWPVDGEAWGELAQLTALQELDICCAEAVACAQLLVLTSLRQLRHLEVLSMALLMMKMKGGH